VLKLSIFAFRQSPVTQMNRAALKDPDDEPSQVPQPGDAFTGMQLRNPLKPGMIQLVDRHRSPPSDVVQDNFT